MGSAADFGARRHAGLALPSTIIRKCSQIVVGVSQLDRWPKEQPVSTGLPKGAPTLPALNHADVSD